MQSNGQRKHLKHWGELSDRNYTNEEIDRKQPPSTVICSLYERQ